MTAWWVLAVVGGPLLLSVLNAWQRRREVAAQWARDDTVAARAEEVALRVETVAERAEAAAANAQETQHAIVAQGTLTVEKLDVIHTLVNSNLTKAVQGELDANVERLATLHELVDLKRAGGRRPTPETLDAIAAVQVRITALRASVADRQRQQQLAEQQTQPG